MPTTNKGAYAKLLSDVDADFKAEDLVDSTPFSVMFGPDKCGATNKVHLIIKHAQPNGTVAERHLVSPPLVEGNGGDKLTHVYTLVLRPSNSSFDLLIDGESRKSGSLLDSALFDPPFAPPKEIDDAEDKKPEDWVEVEKIPDPKATKPEDWDEDAPREIDDDEAVKPEGWLDDEPASIPDPEATQPEDWDEDEDGAWEAPSVPNPKCAAGKAPGCGAWTRPQKPNPAFKGKWTAPLVDNPEYKGVWKPRKVANPDYYEDSEPLKNVAAIGGVAFEIWTMVRAS
jgi:calnexin